MNPRPIVAVVGKPNVGKSSLFNRLVGRPLAIVHDQPGVTRDRHYADVWAVGRSYVLIDTGGFDLDNDDPMGVEIRKQVALAIAEADAVLCVFDAQSGLTDADREAVAMLRRSRKPVIYAANKADTKAGDTEAFDLYRLGIDKIFPISALHGRGLGDLEAALVDALPPGPVVEAPEPSDEQSVETEAPKRPPRVALIGRPNAGKSSLLNRIAGIERVIVDDRPGTTRDPIDIVVEKDGQSMLFIDTAGIRRKGKVTKEADFLEGASVFQAIRAMERCDVAVLMCDGAEGIAEQDAKILGLAVDRGRSIIIAVNKTDLMDVKARKGLEEQARDKLSFVPWAPIVPISAKTGRGVGQLLGTIQDTFTAFRSRVSTGQLNRFFEQVLTTHPPPTMSNRAPRIFFVTQAETAPPHFVVMTNEPEHIHFSYQRYITNQLRKAFGFAGVPLRLTFKKRRRRGEGDEPPSPVPPKKRGERYDPRKPTERRKPGEPRKPIESSDPEKPSKPQKPSKPSRPRKADKPERRRRPRQ
jgi:GTP-binding protein